MAHPQAVPVIAVPTADDDRALLRSFEPVVRFTNGELFLPTAVEPYVASCSLWELDPDESARCVVPVGELTIDRLAAEAAARRGADLSLRFVDRPLGRRESRSWRRRPDRPRFRSGSRFAHVGLLSRALDALFRVSLLLRGTVPGGVVGAAEQLYRQRLDPTLHPYYGRVLREGGYVVLQYWFFYAMNDWRSSFGGANDHEADWEQVTIYLTEGADGECRPGWVAFSAHDEVGDDLRRRWDDPELVRTGDHPVVFAGAGSHSGAFVAGEYVTAVQPPRSLRGVLRLFQAVARLLAPWSRGEIAQGVGIPFVDYSRGDGPAIGPEGARPWTPVLIDEATPWVVAYRGLWGLDTRDRFGGERAPAGPRYERGGAVRQSWFDPLGWAGLQKVPATAAEASAYVQSRVVEIGTAIDELDAELVRRRAEVRARLASTASLRARPDLADVVSERRTEIHAAEQALNRIAQDRALLVAERAAHLEALAGPLDPEPAQAHIRHKVLPSAQVKDPRTRFLRIWSTVSSPLLFAAAAWLIIAPTVGPVVGAALFAVVFLAVEALARRRFASFFVSLVVVLVAGSVALAVVEGVVDRWRIVVGILLLALAVAVLVANLRDLRRG